MMSAELQKWHFNVEQYYRLAEVGVLKPDDRVELIEGEIIRISPIGSPHAACVRALDLQFHNLFARKYVVSVQSPVRLDDFSEPEPDLALLQPRKDLYAERHPQPQDVLLIVEVADSTLLTDRNVKIPLYARFGIRESWLVNLTKKLIEIHYDVEDGRYRNQLKFEKGETLISPTVPDLTLKVDDIIA
jgi:Uma2 family endonuclease